MDVKAGIVGITIGQSPALLGALRGVSGPRATSFFDENSGKGVSLPGRDSSSPRGLFFGGSRSGVPQTGSTNSPTAAFNVLNRTLQEAQKFVPSLQELNIGFQRNASAARAAAREQAQVALLSVPSGPGSESFSSSRSSSHRIEFRRPEPAAQARSFITALNTAAGEAQRRLSGESQGPSGPPSVQFGGQSFSFNTGTGTVLNLTA